MEAAVQNLMGWDDEAFARAARPTYPCLIDAKHVVADLYDMVNVPTAVWIDEEGHIVRPPESGGSGDGFRSMDAATFSMPEDKAAAGRRLRRVYVDALRDWVRNGNASRHALTPEQARERTRVPNARHALATAHFRLGTYLFRQGEGAAAQAHLQRAGELRPESWTFRRQTMVLSDPALTGQLNTDPKFFAAVQSLEGRYYERIDMEGIPEDA